MKSYINIINRNTGIQTSEYTNLKAALRGAREDGNEYGCAVTTVKQQDDKYEIVDTDGEGKEVVGYTPITVQKFNALAGIDG